MAIIPVDPLDILNNPTVKALCLGSLTPGQVTICQKLLLMLINLIIKMEYICAIIAGIDRQIEELDRKIRDIRKEISELEKQIRELKEKIINLELLLSVLWGIVAGAIAAAILCFIFSFGLCAIIGAAIAIGIFTTIRLLQSQLEALRGLLGELEQKLADLNAELEDLNKQVRNLLEQRKTLEESLGDLVGQYYTGLGNVESNCGQACRLLLESILLPPECAAPYIPLPVTP